MNTNKNSFNKNNTEDRASLEWKANFKSALNRLSTQYVLLLRAASSEVALEEGYGMAAGGGGSGNGNGLDPRGELLC